MRPWTVVVWEPPCPSLTQARLQLPEQVGKAPQPPSPESPRPSSGPGKSFVVRCHCEASTQ